MGTGVLACVALFLGIRSAASWRPILVGNIGMMPAEMRISRDGNLLSVVDYSRSRPIKTILDLKTGELDSFSKSSRNFNNRFDASRSLSARQVSPDGKWRLIFEDDGLADAGNNLLLIEARTGKKRAYIGRRSEIISCGFSSDGQLIYAVTDSQTGGFGGGVQTLDVYRIRDAQKIWSTSYVGPVKWLPDGRIGIVERDGFSWRDEMGKEVQHLPGPLQNSLAWSRGITDWALSPDGNWIYSSELSGAIYRWRAR